MQLAGGVLGSVEELAEYWVDSVNEENARGFYLFLAGGQTVQTQNGQVTEKVAWSKGDVSEEFSRI